MSSSHWNNIVRENCSRKCCVIAIVMITMITTIISKDITQSVKNLDKRRGEIL